MLYGTLTVFLDVHCSPLDQHLVLFGTTVCDQRLCHAEFGENDDQYPAN